MRILLDELRCVYSLVRLRVGQHDRQCRQLHATRGIAPTGELMLCPGKQVTGPGSETTDSLQGPYRAWWLAPSLLSLLALGRLSSHFVLMWFSACISFLFWVHVMFSRGQFLACEPVRGWEEGASSSASPSQNAAFGRLVNAKSLGIFPAWEPDLFTQVTD